MGGWQQIRSRIVRLEAEIALALVVSAGFLIAPALRTLTTSPDAELARQDLSYRIDAVAARARTEQRMYSLTLAPGSGRVLVHRWGAAGQAGPLQAESVRALSGEISGPVTVTATTLPNDTITVSDRGFVLTPGRIVFRGLNTGAQGELQVRGAGTAPTNAPTAAGVAAVGAE